MAYRAPRFSFHIQIARRALGEGTKIWHFAHVREKARIGKNCVVGNGVYIDTEIYRK